jgi:hypothetical protein
MAWDSSRPVPWKRLMIEWAVIGVVVAAVAWFVTDNRKPASYVAIALAGGVYVLFGALLAKLGYARKTLKQMRAEAAATPPRKVGAASTSPTGRAKPAPTKRTSSGSSNRPNKKKR